MKADLRCSLYVLVSAAAAAAGLLLTEIALNFYAATTLQIAFLANIVGGVFLLLPFLRGGRPWQGWPAGDWLRLAISGVTIYAAGFVMLFAAIARVGSSKVILLGRVEAIFVVAFAVIFLGERWSARHWSASFLALAGATLISFDPGVLQPALSWGDALTLSAALAVAAGIVILKPLLMRRDSRFVSGLGLIAGAVCLGPFLYADNSLPKGPSLLTAPLFLLLIVVRGLLLGISWATYNAAMREIGASRCAVLFLSVSFLTVALQVFVDAAAPGLGLRVPASLATAVAGGIVISVGVALVQRDPGGSAEES